MTAAIFAIAAAACEGRGQLSGAARMWQAAEQDIGMTADALERLSCIVGLLRVARKRREQGVLAQLRALADRVAGRASPPVPVKVDSRLYQTLEAVRTQREAIQSRRVLAREVSAEMFVLLVDPPAHRDHWLDHIAGLRGLVLDTLERGDAFPSAVLGQERLDAIVDRLDFGSRHVRSVLELGALASRELDYARPAARRRLMAVLRDEVDWTLQRAVTASS